MRTHLKYLFCAMLLLPVNILFSQTINRYGTTAASFLEIGIGSGPNAMGEAQVAVANDVSSIYWNPAGLSNLRGPSAIFMIQPWVVDISMLFTGGAFVIPNVGIIGLGLTQIDYGEMDVTTLDYQDGTGEKFKATDMATAITFSRKIVSWFSFGSSIKYIRSNIWHSSASAVAVDLGVIVDTEFFSRTQKRENGLKIGMSISNYGTRMKYDGIDLYQPIDISEYEDGNYGDVAGAFRTSEWELPLIFRIGISAQPIVTDFMKLTIATDALHPNNNIESVNLGTSLDYKIPGIGEVSVRGGIKSGMDKLFIDSRQFGVMTGVGLKLFYLGNQSISIDYLYKSMGILGNVQAYTVSIFL